MFIEEKRGKNTPGPGALHHVHLTAVDAIRITRPQTGKRLLHLPRKSQKSFQPLPVQFTAGYIVLRKQAARGFDPAGGPVVGADAVAAFRMVFEYDLHRAFVGGLRQDLELAAAA